MFQSRHTGGPEGATRLLCTPVAQVVVDHAVQHNTRLSVAGASVADEEEAAEGPAALWAEGQGDTRDHVDRKQQAKLLRSLSQRVSTLKERGE